MFGVFQKKSQFIQKATAILEEKNFDNKEKELLMSALEDLDKNYKNYEMVKVFVKKEEQYKEEILKILETLEEIEIKKSSGKNKSIKLTNEKPNTLTCVNNKISCFNGLVSLKLRKFLILKKHAYAEVLSRILKEASIDVELEILAEFDAWSWQRKSKNIICNYKQVIYQNLLWILGTEFIEKWKNSDPNDGITDYMDYMINILIQKYGKKDTKKLMLSLEQLLHSLATEKELVAIKKIATEDERIINLMQDVEKFLEFLNLEKQKLQEKLIKLDKVINDSELLAEAFAIKKKILIEEGISKEEIEKFTLNEYIQILETERNVTVETIEEYIELQTPEKFAEYKEKIEKRLKFLKSPNKDEAILEFQETILDIMYDKLNYEENKEIIFENIKNLRYLRYLKYAEGKEGYLTIEIYQKMDKILKRLVYNAINTGMMNKVSLDFYTNYPILSPALKTDIVDFRQIQFSVFTAKTLLLHIITENILYKEIELIEVDPKLVSIKSKKKYNLFNKF